MEVETLEQLENAFPERRRMPRPMKWNLLVHRETDMEGVAEFLSDKILVDIVGFDKAEADALAGKVNKKGTVLGSFSKDIALTKVKRIQDAADLEGMPLKATAKVCEEREQDAV